MEVNGYHQLRYSEIFFRVSYFVFRCICIHMHTGLEQIGGDQIMTECNFWVKIHSNKNNNLIRIFNLSSIFVPNYVCVYVSVA